MLRRRFMVIAQYLWWIFAASKIWLKRAAKIITAPAALAKVHRGTKTGAATPLVGNPAQEIEATSRVWAAKITGLASRLIVQPVTDSKVFAAVVSGLTACAGSICHRVAAITMGCVYAAIQAPGAVAAYCKAVFSALAAGLAAAGTVLGSITHRVQNGSQAAVSTGTAEAVAASDTAPTATALSAAAAATAAAGADAITGTGSSGALICWIYPQVIGTTLQIEQVFSGVQDEDVVEIDMEEQSVYWANAFLSDGILDLVFVETAEQNGDILEVT